MDTLLQRLGFSQGSDKKKRASALGVVAGPNLAQPTKPTQTQSIEPQSETRDARRKSESRQNGRHGEFRRASVSPFVPPSQNVVPRNDVDVPKQTPIEQGTTLSSERGSLNAELLSQRETMTNGKAVATSEVEELSEEDSEIEAGPRARQFREVYDRQVRDIMKAAHRIMMENINRLEGTHGVDDAELRRVCDQMLTKVHDFAQDEFADIMTSTKAVECFNNLDQQHLELLRRGEVVSLPFVEAEAAGGSSENASNSRDDIGGAFAAELKDLGMRSTPTSSQLDPPTGCVGRNLQGTVSSMTSGGFSDFPLSAQSLLVTVDDELTQLSNTLQQTEQRKRELEAQIAAEDEELQRLQTEALRLLQSLQTDGGGDITP